MIIGLIFLQIVMTVSRGTKRQNTVLERSDITIQLLPKIVKKSIQVVPKNKSKNKSIQLGLCCLNTVLRAQKPSVFASRKMIMRTVIRDSTLR